MIDTDKLNLIVSSSALIGVVAMLLQNSFIKKQNNIWSALEIVNWLEDMRLERHILYQVRDEKRQDDLSKWSDAEKEAASKVCRWLDILGMLDSLQYVDRCLVDRFYAIPARELWEICDAYVRDQQSSRGKQHLWEFTQFASKVRHVKENHPAIANTEKWPRDSRKPRSA